MNPQSSVRIRFEALRSKDAADISSGYTIIGTPFQNPVRMIKVWNDTDANVILSGDGLTPDDFCPTGTGFIYDYSSNKSEQGGYLEQAAFDRIYVKLESTAATTGTIYVTVIYAASV